VAADLGVARFVKAFKRSESGGCETIALAGAGSGSSVGEYGLGGGLDLRRARVA